MSDKPNDGTPGTPPAAPAPPAPEPPPRSSEEWAAALARTNKESAERRIALRAETEARTAVEAELAKLKAEKAAAEAEKLKAQGEWQKLAETETAKSAELSAKLTAAESKAAKFEAGLKARETVLLEKIPEAARAKLKLESLPLEDRVSTLESLAEMLAPAAPPPPNAPDVKAPPVPRSGPTPQGSGKTRFDQIKAIQADRSLTPAQRAKKLADIPKG